MGVSDPIKLPVAENVVPIWFADLDVIRPSGILKPKSACYRENAFLHDDQKAVIVPGGRKLVDSHRRVFVTLL